MFVYTVYGLTMGSGPLGGVVRWLVSELTAAKHCRAMQEFDGVVTRSGCA